MKAHAKLSASGAHRWMACPGSVKAEEGRPERRSAFADEGSAAHELMEICMVKGLSPHDLIDKPLVEFNGHIVSQDMADAVGYYIDYVNEFGDGDRIVEIEQPLDFSAWVPEGWGTADTVVYNPKTKTVDVIDLKYGRNKVDVYENPQGLLYLLGTVDHFFEEIETYRFHIVQPRIDHVDMWTISHADLMVRGEAVKQIAALALAPDAERIPGEKQCQYCKAKADCPALAKVVTDTLMTDFDTMKTVNPDRLDDETLRKVLDAKKLIVSWLDAVEERAVEVLNEKGSFPGYKLVEGRSTRKWASDTDAEKRLLQLLGEDAYEKTILSVAKAEKVLGKKRVSEVSDLIEKPKGKATLAPESDPRHSIFDVLKDFDSIE